MRADTVVKPSLLTQIFNDSQDDRITFFEKFFDKHTPLCSLEALVALRRIVLDGAEIPTHLLKDSYVFSCPIKIVDQGEGSHTKYPPVEIPCFKAFFDLVIRGNRTIENRILWRGGKQVRNRVSRQIGVSTFLSFLTAAVVIFAYYFECAKRLNGAGVAQLERNIADGTCKWTIDGCSNDEAKYSCYRPQVSHVTCDSPAYVFYLSLLVLLIAATGYVSYNWIQNRSLFQCMQSSCNDAKYDVLLNAIFRTSRRAEIDYWAEPIRVNGQSCTRRTFALIVLLCFDDRMHTADGILTNLIKAFENEQSHFALSPEGFLEVSDNLLALAPR